MRRLNVAVASPLLVLFLFCQAEDGIRAATVTGVQTCALPIFLDRTPAYAESGGQVGDTGTLVGRSGRGQLVDTYYRGSKLIVHRVKVVSGGFHENEDVAVTGETTRRQGLRRHHTGTQLPRAGLRALLG